MNIPIVITRTMRAAVMGYRFVPALAFFVVSSITVILAADVRAQELAFSRAAEDAAARLAEAFPLVQGSVVGLEGDRVLIDLGTKQKIHQGMELQVYREGDEVKHPVTGQVLGRRDKRLGLLKVVEVKEGFSEAVLVSRPEGSTITAGDLVRVSPDRLSVALPLIDAGEVKGADVYSVTKDLAISLAKTGRFMVIEDHLVRAALMGEKPLRFESFADPAILKTLAEKARVQLLILAKLSPADRGALLNLQVLSVFTGAPLTVASVEVTGPQLRVTAAPSAPPGEALRPGSGQASLGTAPPSFVRVQPQPAGPSKTAAQPIGPLPEGSPLQKPPVPGDIQGKAGTPSFLVKGEDRSGQSTDQASKDHLTIELAEPLLEIAAGDLDADRRPEVVGITSSEVIVYRWQDRRLVPIARAESDPFLRHLHLDVADVNGSGQAQLFVTAMSSVPEGLKLRNSLRSFVLGLRDGKLVRIADGLEYFLRVLTGPGIEAPMLIGQRMGQQAPFDGPIVRLSWIGERYVEDRPLTLPAQVKGLYDFAPLESLGDEILEVAVITEQRVKTYGRGGEALWEGKEDLGEVDHLAFFHTSNVQAIRFKHGLRSGAAANPEEYADRLVLPRRVLVQASPLWGSARVEVLTLANSTKYGVQVAVGGEPPPTGRVIAYDRLDGTFARGWETIPVEGKVRDVAVVDLNGSGKKALLVLSAVKEKGFVATLKEKARGIINVFSFTGARGG
jgi:hypothetical protein